MIMDQSLIPIKSNERAWEEAANPYGMILISHWAQLRLVVLPVHSSNNTLYLSSSDGLAAFRAFLRTEFSEENLEFWLACEDYKKIKSQSKMASKAKKIFAEYIAIQSCKEVRQSFEHYIKAEATQRPRPVKTNQSWDSLKGF